MRYLCIDLGDKRTGLALGDNITGLVSPLETLEVPRSHAAGSTLLNALARAVDAHLAPQECVVLGLPLNMDGTEGPRAALVRALGDSLADLTRRPVLYHDERLSTAAADWRMARTGLTRREKKERRDALAAAEILNDFLASRQKRPPEAQE